MKRHSPLLQDDDLDQAGGIGDKSSLSRRAPILLSCMVGLRDVRHAIYTGRSNFVSETRPYVEEKDASRQV